MNIRLRIISFFIASLSFFQPLWADNIVFDLDLVLFHTNEKAAAKHMNIFKAVDGMIKFKQSPTQFKNHIQTKFGEVLFKVSLLNANTCSTQNCALNINGDPYPPIMCAWLDGTMTNKEIRRLVLSNIKANPDWFEEKVEQKIICNLVNMVFTPENFIGTRKLYKNSFRLLKQLKQEGHNIYILSNWDTESFELLKIKFSRLFKYVDGAIISGETKSLKPAPNIYGILLDQYNLAPQNTWFIDNQQENIDTACSLNMHGILCVRKGHKKRPDTDLIREQLEASQKQ